MIRNNYKIVCFFFFLIFFGCAAIPEYKDLDLVPIKDVSLIEGEYENIPFNKEYRIYGTFDNVINWRTKPADSTKFSSVRVNIIKSKLIGFTFTNTKDEKKVVYTKWKLHKNGFIRLKNRNFRIIGLPYIFGSYQINKTDLALTENNELILNGTNVDEGAILVILPLGLPASNFTYKFKRK